MLVSFDSGMYNNLIRYFGSRTNDRFQLFSQLSLDYEKEAVSPKLPVHVYSKHHRFTVINNSFQTTEDLKMSERNYGRIIPKRTRIV